MSEKNPHLFYGLVAVAVALVICSVIASSAVIKVKRAGDTISVTGSARKSIVSDLIIWRGSVAAQGPNLQDAYAEVKKYSNRVKAYFKDKKVPDESLVFGSIDTQGLHEILEDGRQSPRIVGYQLTQSFELKSTDVSAIDGLSRDATELIKEGIPLNSYPPEYFYTKLADLRIQMLEESTKDARLRAEKIAESAGSKIGPVRGARQGVFQITPLYSTEVSDYGVSDTTSREKDITAVVTITFAVE